MSLEEILNEIKYVDDLQKVDKKLLTDKSFVEKVLYKLGKSEDFSPDQILDYAGTELKENKQFILETFMKVITLVYTRNYLFSNHQETVSYFYDNHVSDLLKDEEFSIQLLQEYCNSPLLKSRSFLADIKENNDYEWADLDEENDENLKEYLIRSTISDTTFNNPDSFIKIIDIAGWNTLEYIPEHFKTNEKIFAHALKKNIKAKKFVPQSLTENSELIKSIIHNKKAIKISDRIQLTEISGQPLAGKTLLFTGTLSKMSREEAEKLAEAAGAKILSAVSKNLNYLVVGEKAGSKLEKAQKIGIPIISELEFFDMIK